MMENNKDYTVELKCFQFWSDQTDIVKVKIDVSKYHSFTAEWRLGNWYLKGRCRNSNDVEKEEELIRHGIVGLAELAKFISEVDKLYPNHSKVNKFINYHSSSNFYPELQKLKELICKFKK